MIKDCLLEAIAANPLRSSPWADQEPGNEHLVHLPPVQWVRRFLLRHRLVPRRSMPLNHGRAILTVDDLDEWQKLTEKALFEDPELAEAMQNPARVFNQDETSLCPGVEHQRVLTPKGWDGPVYNAGGDKHLHITASITVSADGEYTGVRLVYKGERRRTTQLKGIPENGVTGKWESSVAPNGYVTRAVFLEILEDLVKHLDEKQIPRPVVLFMDGYSGHLGPAISDFATENGIALRLLR